MKNPAYYKLYDGSGRQVGEGVVQSYQTTWVAGVLDEVRIVGAETPLLPLPVLPQVRGADSVAKTDDGCECGAYVAHGSPRGDAAHSGWCPWK